MSGLTHFDAKGDAHMVDVSEKKVSERRATACASVLMQKDTLQLILSGGVRKGDVLQVARCVGGPPLAPRRLFAPLLCSLLLLRLEEGGYSGCTFGCLALRSYPKGCIALWDLIVMSCTVFPCFFSVKGLIRGTERAMDIC